MAKVFVKIGTNEIKGQRIPQKGVKAARSRRKFMINTDSKLMFEWLNRTQWKKVSDSSNICIQLTSDANAQYTYNIKDFSIMLRSSN